MPKGAFTLHSDGATTPVSSTQDNTIAFTLRAAMLKYAIVEKCLIIFRLVLWHRPISRQHLLGNLCSAAPDFVGVSLIINGI